MRQHSFFLFPCYAHSDNEHLLGDLTELDGFASSICGAEETSFPSRYARSDGRRAKVVAEPARYAPQNRATCCGDGTASFGNKGYQRCTCREIISLAD